MPWTAVTLHKPRRAAISSATRALLPPCKGVDQQTKKAKTPKMVTALRSLLPKSKKFIAASQQVEEVPREEVTQVQVGREDGSQVCSALVLLDGDGDRVSQSRFFSRVAVSRDLSNTWCKCSQFEPKLLNEGYSGGKKAAVLTCDQVRDFVARKRGVEKSWVQVSALCFCQLAFLMSYSL